MRPAVLIVEDSDDTRELLAEYLMVEGFHSIMARSGADALKRLAEIWVDVIITDLHMPEMDGVAFVRQLRSLAEFRETPVVLLTALAREDAERRLADASVSVEQILRKPVPLDRLVASLNELLAGRRPPPP